MQSPEGRIGDQRRLCHFKAKLDNLLLQEALTEEALARQRELSDEKKRKEEETVKRAQQQEQAELDAILDQARQIRQRNEIPFQEQQHAVLATKDVDVARHELAALIKEEELEARLKKEREKRSQEEARQQKVSVSLSMEDSSNGPFGSTPTQRSRAWLATSMEVEEMFANSTTSMSGTFGNRRSRAWSQVSAGGRRGSRVMSKQGTMTLSPMSSTLSPRPSPSSGGRLSPTTAFAGPLSPKSAEKQLTVVEKMQLKHAEELQEARAQLQAQEKAEHEYTDMRAKLRAQVLYEVFGLTEAELRAQQSGELVESPTSALQLESSSATANVTSPHAVDEDEVVEWREPKLKFLEGPVDTNRFPPLPPLPTEVVDEAHEADEHQTLPKSTLELSDVDVHATNDEEQGQEALTSHPGEQPEAQKQSEKGERQILVDGGHQEAVPSLLDEYQFTAKETTVRAWDRTMCTAWELAQRCAHQVLRNMQSVEGEEQLCDSISIALTTSSNQTGRIQNEGESATVTPTACSRAEAKEGLRPPSILLAGLNSADAPDSPSISVLLDDGASSSLVFVGTDSSASRVSLEEIHR